MIKTYAKTGSRSAPKEQTGERDWSWDVRDGVPFRRLSTVFGCFTADAETFEDEYFQKGFPHPDLPLMLVDDSRSERRDGWTGISFFRVDYLGSATDTQGAGLFKPAVTVEKVRYLTAGLMANGGYGALVSAGYVPRLTVTHVHDEEVDDAAYAVYLDVPRRANQPPAPFFERRLYVMTERLKTQIGGYWQYRDVFSVPFGLRLDSSPGFISFDGCTHDDTFQDRLDRSAVILNDFVAASAA